MIVVAKIVDWILVAYGVIFLLPKFIYWLKFTKYSDDQPRLKYRGFWPRWVLWSGFFGWLALSYIYWYFVSGKIGDIIFLGGLMFWFGFICGAPEGSAMRKHNDIEDELERKKENYL